MQDGFYTCSQPRLVSDFHSSIGSFTWALIYLSNKYFLSPWDAISMVLHTKIQHWVRRPSLGTLYSNDTSISSSTASLLLDPICLSPAAHRDLEVTKLPRPVFIWKTENVPLSLHVLALAWDLWWCVQFSSMTDTTCWRIFCARH